MDIVMFVVVTTLLYFLLMLTFSEAGRRIGIRTLQQDPEGHSKGTGAAEGAVFGLLGLLIALTFSGAAARFQDRHFLVADEANAIGTAYLRLDLLPADAQPEIKEWMRRYVDVRMATYADVADDAATRARLADGAILQQRIWSLSVAATRRPDAMPQAAIVLLPAMNEMLDITTTRVMAARNHPPTVVFVLMAALGLLGALMVGYATSANTRRNWFHTLSFAAILSLTIYVIVDMEHPRLGLIRVDSADRILVELKDTMR